METSMLLTIAMTSASLAVTPASLAGAFTLSNSSWTAVAKAPSIAPSVPALRSWSCTPFARAASCASCMLRSAFALFGFTLGKQLEPLRRQFGHHECDAREVAAPNVTRSGARRKENDPGL
jgi:hypothetical protein